MALFMQHKDDECQWGIWKTEESFQSLLDLLPHENFYKQGLLNFSSEHRRMEWLSVRVLLFTLLGEEKMIAYYPSGKPYLQDNSFSISISHTYGYVAVIIAPSEKQVGIDIEHYGERVHNVATKYMRADEITSLYDGVATWSLLLHWSAKEVMFKCLDTPDVNLQHHLRIFPFSISDSGSFNAEEYRTLDQHKFRIHYLLNAEFVLTWQISSF